MLVLPALLAPTGMNWTWCMCAAPKALHAAHACCEVESAAPIASCCDDDPASSPSNARLHAPCKLCRELATPAQNLNRAERGERASATFSLFALEPRFAADCIESAGLGLAVARALHTHAPPHATRNLPLRI